MLIKCPECGQNVSSEVENCIHCGYPIKEYIETKAHEEEVRKLTEKILPCEFTVPTPRIKVCIKCTHPFSSVLSDFRQPNCSCGFPGVEVDYQEYDGGNGYVATMAYILESCVIPRNIGDYESEEYKTYVKGLYDRLEECGIKDKRNPPNPKYFGREPTQKDFDAAEQAMRELHESLKKEPTPDVPHCPSCHSTDLSKISVAKKGFKVALFGFLGTGDNGKTWKCNNCGTKF